MNILSIENVSKRYATKTALDNVTFEIPRGSVYGLLGPNGAGKTTLLRIINHITAPDEGKVFIDGHQLSEADVSRIGYLPEERGLYKKMRVGEQALFFARLKGLSRQDATTQLKEWFERFGIADWWNRKVEELSKGMAQKVQFIVTVLHKPDLLIFDEPFSGFDPINADLLKREILRLRDEGATVIFSTHNMASVEEICDNITLINQGKNILTGEVDEIRSRHSRGRYTITYTGESDEVLLNALKPLLQEMERQQSADGLITLDLRLKPEVSIRPILGSLNESFNIKSVNSHIASMNEIFINSIATAE